MKKIKISNLPKDDNGIPVVENPQIEQVALQTLDHIDPMMARKPQKISIKSMQDWFNSKLGITFVSKVIDDINEKQVLGFFEPTSKKVVINQDVNISEDRRLFTFAHELGHVVFHREVDIRKHQIDWFDTEDEIADSYLVRKNFTKPKEWLEWQANKFAAYLLMPKIPFMKYLFKVQSDLGYAKSKRGYIYLDDTPSNKDDYRRIIERFKVTFGVSYTAIERRFCELNILEDHRSESLAPAYSFLRLEGIG